MTMLILALRMISFGEHTHINGSERDSKMSTSKWASQNPYSIHGPMPSIYTIERDT